jgi:hypothetical protein
MGQTRLGENTAAGLNITIEATLSDINEKLSAR